MVVKCTDRSSNEQINKRGSILFSLSSSPPPPRERKRRFTLQIKCPLWLPRQSHDTGIKGTLHSRKDFCWGLEPGNSDSVLVDVDSIDIGTSMCYRPDGQKVSTRRSEKPSDRRISVGFSSAFQSMDTAATPTISQSRITGRFTRVMRRIVLVMTGIQSV